MSNTTDSIPGERLREQIQRTVDGSRVVAATRAVQERVAQSGVRRGIDRTIEYTQASFIYRWLTKEPDPEVVVIDLRETYTVGPVIALLDTIISHVAPWWRESRLARSVQRVERILERAADTRPGRTLQRLLEPPEPPNDDERDDTP